MKFLHIDTWIPHDNTDSKNKVIRRKNLQNEERVVDKRDGYTYVQLDSETEKPTETKKEKKKRKKRRVKEKEVVW